MGKLEDCGLDYRTVRWTGNWLGDRTPRVVVSGVSSNWREVSSGVPQGSLLGLALFNIFIRDLDEGVEGLLIKSADDAKLGGVANTQEDRVKIQQDLNTLEKWAVANRMQFNKAKCPVSHLGHKHVKHKYWMGDAFLGSSACERDLGDCESNTTIPVASLLEPEPPHLRAKKTALGFRFYSCTCLRCECRREFTSDARGRNGRRLMPKRMLPSARRSRCFWALLAGVPISIFLYACRLPLWTQLLLPPLQPTLPPSCRQSVTLSDGTLTFHLNLSRYEAQFPHLQHHPCRTVIAEAGVCRRVRGPPLLLLAVKSHPASSGRRAALRRTWARPGEAGGYRLQPLFLMAMTPDARHLSLVRRESSHFGDVVLWDFLESHHNLSLKEHCFLQWLQRHCQQAAFVFKGDDDLFMNPEALAGYLRHTPNASLFIHGNIQRHSAVMRRGKYSVSRTLYPLDHYPYFASGGGFVLPSSSIPALYQASLRLPIFPLDDVYLGFLALAAGQSFSHDERFRVWGAPKDEPEVFRESFTVHGIPPEKMEEVWKGLRSPPR